MVDVILIHGTTQSAAGYGPLAGQLAARGHRPLAPDLPTDRPEWDAETYAEHVVATTSPVDEPIVVGHSGAGLLLPAIGRRTGA